MSDTLEKNWQILVNTALLGTERQPLPLPEPTDGLSSSLHKLAGLPAEKQNLLAAALLGACRKAALGVGVRDPLDQPPSPAPAEPLAVCSPQAAACLSRILGNKWQQLLMEYLQLLQDHRQLAPTRMLPELLDQGRKNLEVRTALMKVIGERGRWLAMMNPAWDYAASGGAAAEQAWQTGKKAARLQALTEIRTLDPARGRALLEEAWKSEGAVERASLLGALEEGLNPEDEAFLEAALDDRSMEVRAIAADLLTRLPESALVGRMQERGLALLKFQPGFLLVKPSLEVILPKDVDDAMARDGIKKGGGKKAEKSERLAYIIQSIPPRFWNQTWKASPRQILEAAKDSDWFELLGGAWTIAAAVNKDVEWLEELLGHFPSGAIFNQLPDERRELYLLGWLNTKNYVMAWKVLADIKKPLGYEASAAVFDQLWNLYVVAQSTTHSEWEANSEVYHLCYYLHPRVVERKDRLTGVKNASSSHWEGLTEKVVDLLSFRQEMWTAVISTSK